MSDELYFDKDGVEHRIITEEMLQSCAIPERPEGRTVRYSDGNWSYEDDVYICWNGMCVRKDQ